MNSSAIKKFVIYHNPRCANSREALERLRKAGIATRPGIMAAHREPPYVALAPSLPITEGAADETLALPIYHQMTDADQDRVVASLLIPRS